MNITKKLFSYIVAIAMICTLTAFAGGAVNAAETTYKLTLNGTTEGHTYEAYQIFTGDLSTNPDKTKVLSNVKWGTGVTYTGTESVADVAKALGKNEMTIDQLLKKLTLTTPVQTVESSKDTTVINGLVAGYYLVKDKDGTQDGKSDAYTNFIVQVVGDSVASVKSDVPTVVKKVKDINDTEGNESGWQDSADYDINDEIPYQITGTMPDNIGDYTTYKYVFTDTMSKGLTYTANTAKITIGEKDVTDYFKEKTTTNEDDSTTVTWSCDDLKVIKDVTLDENTTVVVTYKATLNENAVIGSAGNPNTVNLIYSNNPNNSGKGETGKTPDDKNIVFTYKAVVNKVDQEQKSLAGAAFKLEKKNNQGVYNLVKSFTAGNDTTFEFKGLDDGDYKLTETTTPAGYNTITPIEFTISADHDTTADEPALTRLSVTVTKGKATFTPDKGAGSLTTNVVNKKGSTLPETGGMGTTLLYAVGGVLVALAAAYIIISKKHEKAE